ncbi:hypothetical protein [Haliangium ochraceum]|uniref:Carboxypeptidase regulatory-like domain-containing protein n=1 Tax=Haliangium ochraceum (strain DSM 14365 / JCM 11303 / SMP-2) TaxID=502025 RepID=D0LZ60_HALO1|nr:hypothetical protein [Haliangium ochraceum]ACY16322.1 hypothetical protein Hoch_3822 [Haliangium ochraceum DSM 14365]
MHVPRRIPRPWQRAAVSASAAALLTSVALALGACLVPTEPWPDEFGIRFEGVVVGSEPVRGATVEVWQVNDDGARIGGGPHRTAETDEQGRFAIHTGRRFKPPFVVIATGGTTSEYWSADLPTRETEGQVTEAVRHGLVLAALSGIAHQAAQANGRSLQAMNILHVSEALAEDARGPGALIDGVGPDGAVALGTCGDACLLPADALRGR